MMGPIFENDEEMKAEAIRSRAFTAKLKADTIAMFIAKAEAENNPDTKEFLLHQIEQMRADAA